MTSISVVTPWREHAELIATYESSVKGAEVVIISQGSSFETNGELLKMTNRLGGKLIKNETNVHFARANNQGLAVATGDIVVCLNNDIQAHPSWLTLVAQDVKPGAFYGPSHGARVVDGQPIAYIEGWCIAATRDAWAAIGGWDDVAFEQPYWEDNDLCFRAMQAGYKLRKTSWAITHFSNYTNKGYPENYKHSESNRRLFEERVRAARV